jgi:hypothetical protein
MKNLNLRLALSGLVFVIAVCGIILSASSGRILSGLGLSNTITGTLELSSPDKVALNQPFDISVIINTQGKNVNAVGAYLLFDPTKLQVMQMDTKPSFCQFYPEKKFDNQLGTISLACGTPHPGVNGRSVLMNIQFIPHSLGQTTIYLDPRSQILASDGKGTNILTTFPQKVINVINSF